MDTEKTKSRALSFEGQLASRVMVNAGAEVVSEDINYIQMKVKLQLGAVARFLKKFVYVRDYRKYLLTDFNCLFFRHIREKSYTVLELIYWLADREKLSFFEARALVLQYVGDLMKRGLVVVEIPHGEVEEEDAD